MSAKTGIFIIMTVSVILFAIIGVVTINSEPIFARENESNIISISSNISNINSSQDVSSAASSIIDKNKFDGKITTAFLSPYIAADHYKNIYINNKTKANINLKELYNTKIDIRFNMSKEPEVLILHTHGTEGYMTERKDGYLTKEVGETKDFSRSVILSGDILKSALEKYGICVIHDKTLHDDPSYTKSYSRSAETIKKYTDEYPSIKIIIDLHRDSVSTNGGQIRGISRQNGKDAAQIMFVCGSETGNVTDHPNWKKNFRLVMHLQEIAETLYPGFARSVYLTSKKYNQQLSPGAILVEVGSAVNTVNEVKYATELLGKILGIGFGMLAEEK